jgi:hypothetical protein
MEEAINADSIKNDKTENGEKNKKEAVAENIKKFREVYAAAVEGPKDKKGRACQTDK